MRPSDELEQLLSAAPHLDDAGFTARVMARLPESRSRASARRAVVLAVSLCAAFAGALTLPGFQVALAAVSDALGPLLAVASDPARAAAQLASVGMGALAVQGIVLVMIVWGAAALAREP